MMMVILKYIGKKCDAFLLRKTILKARKKMTKMLNDRRKTMQANAIHAQAIVSDSAHLGYGNFINARAVFRSNSKSRITV